MIPLFNKSEFRLTFNQPNKGVKIFSAIPASFGQGKVIIELDRWVVEHLKEAMGMKLAEEKEKFISEFAKLKLSLAFE
ncbi:hypothetical protein HYX02_00285 [Candidatus Woesearchaeota archaeon]|nr:hypothetical protein [Candidatus Woesearchaeota archaeon]